MWIVRLALRRPYTFVVLAMLIAVTGVLSIVTMPVDIFPKINIPVISVIWSYGALSPDEMQDRITTIVERALTTTVNNIEHIESQSVRGNSVIKMYFQPGTDIADRWRRWTAGSAPLPSSSRTRTSPRSHRRSAGPAQGWGRNRQRGRSHRLRSPRDRAFFTGL